MRLVVLLLAFVVALAVAWVVASEQGGAAPERSSRPGGSSAAGAADLAERIAQIEDRLAALERTGTTDLRTAVEPNPNTDLLARVEALETELSRLRASVAAPNPLPETAAGVVQALADKNLYGHNVAPALVQRRMDLRRRLLELAPDDPRAAAALAGLKDDYIMASNAEAARRVLDAFGGRVAIPHWKLDLHYAHVDWFGGHADRAREIYARVSSDAAVPEHERASAQFSLAYTFMQESRYDEARRHFHALLAQWGDETPPMLRNTVAGARNQLSKMDEWERQRASKGKR